MDSANETVEVEEVYRDCICPDWYVNNPGCDETTEREEEDYLYATYILPERAADEDAEAAA